MGVLLGLEQSLEDCIRFSVVGNHNVLIAAERSNEEAADVVCV